MEEEGGGGQKSEGGEGTKTEGTEGAEESIFLRQIRQYEADERMAAALTVRFLWECAGTLLYISQSFSYISNSICSTPFRISLSLSFSFALTMLLTLYLSLSLTHTQSFNTLETMYPRDLPRRHHLLLCLRHLKHRGEDRHWWREEEDVMARGSRARLEKTANGEEGDIAGAITEGGELRV